MKKYFILFNCLFILFCFVCLLFVLSYNGTNNNKTNTIFNCSKINYSEVSYSEVTVKYIDYSIKNFDVSNTDDIYVDIKVVSEGMTPVGTRVKTRLNENNEVRVSVQLKVPKGKGRIFYVDDGVIEYYDELKQYSSGSRRLQFTSTVVDIIKDVEIVRIIRGEREEKRGNGILRDRFDEN